MRFSDPHWLWAALLLPPLLFLFRWLEGKARRRTLRKLLGPVFAEKLVLPSDRRLEFINTFLLFLGLGFLFLALARPLLEEREEKVDRLGIDFLVAVDTSRSMLAEDVEPNRITAARNALRFLLGKLSGDRMGLLAFAGEARMIAPLTFDTTALDKVIDSIDEKTLWLGGTSITKVIDLAARKFEEKKLESRVLVLITDGEDLEGDAALSARKAYLDHGIRIFTLGVGTNEGVNIPIHKRNKEGEIVKTWYVKGPDRRRVITRIDEEGLKKIARATGGDYYPAGKDNEGVTRLYREGLLSLADRMDTREMSEAVEGYRWFLVPSIACFLLQNLFVRGKRRVKEPNA